MKLCNYVQAQLLEHLYGLVDDAPRRELEEHLTECADCRRALDRARQEQMLLATAAKKEFAGVEFAPPAVVEMDAGEVERTTIPVSSGWFRWGVAAAILLGMIGLGLPAGLYSAQQDRVENARARMQRMDAVERDARQRADLANAELAKIEREILEIQNQRGLEVAKVWEEASKKPMRMTVSGPRTPDPGAVNTYQIQVRNRDNVAPIPAELSVKVTDEKGKVLHEVDRVKTTGNYQLVLPRDLPLKPNMELALEVTARADNGMKAEIKEKLKLVAPVYLTHLTTDKPMYRPGETVHFRSLTLERFSLRPADEDLELSYTITKPNGEQVPVLNAMSRVADDRTKELLRGPDGKPIRGLGAGEFLIDGETKGGEYTLSVRDTRSRILPQERKFLVNVYEKPRLNKEMELTRKSYGPGEKVVAAAKATRAEGGAVADRPVTATMNVDGAILNALNPNLRTDAQGAVEAQFQLPKEIAKGEVSVSLTFNDGGSVETIVRPVPVVLSKLEVEFFPEGGDMIAGVPNRIYFQTRTTLGKPAELKGRIMDETNAVACDVETFSDPRQPFANHGIGAFSFTPLEGKKYRLQVDVPAGITELVGAKNAKGGEMLPAVKQDGVVLTVASGVTTDKDPIQVQVRSAKADRQLLVGAYCRGRLMDHQRLLAKKGQAAHVELRPEVGAGGVYRVTVFEERMNGDRSELAPVAERLIYREPAERLKLAATADKQRFVPGERVTLNFKATDEKGQPAPAIVMVAAVDNSVLKMADEKTHKSLPTHFLLATEVRRPEDLEHADFLIGAHPSARVALDMLLGTQGWRRFVEQQDKPAQYRQQRQEKDVDRLLVLNGQLMPEMLRPETTAPEARAARDVYDSFDPKFEPSQKQRLRAEERKIAVDAEDAALQNRIEGKDGERAAAQKDLDAQKQRLAGYETMMGTVRAVGLPALLLALLVLSVVMLGKGVNRSESPIAVPYLVGSACAFLVFALLSVVLVWGGIRSLEPMVGTAEKAAAPRAAMPMAPGQGGAGRGLDRFDEIEADKVNVAPAAAAFDPAQPPRPGAMPAPNAPQKRPVAKMAANGGALNQPKDDRGDGKGEAKAEGGALRLAEARDGIRGARQLNRHQAAQAQNDRRKAVMAGEPVRERLEKAKEQAGKDMDMMFKKGLGGPGFGAGLNGNALADEELQLAAALPPPPCIVREYAHHHSSATPGVRSDFTETVLWHPAIVLPDGKGNVSFDLSDSVTTFQVYAAGHTLDGRLGAVSVPVESRLPLTIEPKLPTEVTASDRIDVPVSIANNTDKSLGVNVRIDPAGLALVGGRANERLTIDADQRTRRVYRVRPTIVDGEVTLRFDGMADGIAPDRILKSIKVVPEGFPYVGAQSDVLEKVALHNLELPEKWVKGTLQYRVTVYPSTLASLQKGLEGLLREPGGCFEQTSTSNYPNLLVLDYLKSTEQANPEVERRARGMLDRGYQMLTSFECTDPQSQKRGYEWFGGTAPAHEALTAYGLMQFRDMARVHDVDKAMVERTRVYLMAQRDGKGGFKRNPRALDTFGRAPDHITNAYIVWAVTEGGKDDDILKELDAALEKAKTSKDPYFLALVANALINRDRTKDAIALLDVMKEKQQADGHLDAEQTSITGSGGRDLQIETTAMSLMAWLRAQRPEKYNVATQKAVEWIGKQRGGHGSFGSTQSTILALKALIAYANANKKTAEAGEIILYSEGKVVARQAFPAGASEGIVLELKDADKLLHAGKNKLSVEITGKSSFPYTATWTYRTVKPVSAEKAPVRIGTKLDRTNLKEGETARLTVTAENVSGKGQGMAVAVIGLPGGMTIPEDMKQLKDLAKLRNDGTERGPIDFFEIRGRELVLYWRDMAPGKKIEVSLDLIARVPGQYRGPASRGYLYYNADHKHWIDPIEVNIEAGAAD
jgi:hypothetical protein